MSQEHWALDEFVEFAMATMHDGLPAEVATAARNQLTDSVGVAMAGHDEPSVDAVTALVAEWGSTGRARAYGSQTGLQPSHAALVNGAMAHSLDFDDTHGPSVLHPSASVVSAAVAVAQAVDAGLETLIRSIALGNELVVRLGMAGTDEHQHNSIFFERGLHATSICGAVGSALAAGLVAGAPESQLADAVSIACSMGSGVLEANRTGGTVKRIHCGWAAFAGVTAVDLARLGISGPRSVLEGRFGFLQAFCGDRANPAWLTGGLRSHWEMRRIGFKPYPTNGFTHAVIDAALELRGKGIQPEYVRTIDVRLPAPVLRTVAEPREVKIRPVSGYAARFSAPWVFALALRGGGGLGLALDDFSEQTLHDPVLQALAAKVQVRSDDYCDAAFPRDVPAIVTAHTTEGETIEVTIPHRRGSVDNPMTSDEVRRKFVGNAGRVLGEGAASDLYGMINSDDGTVADILAATIAKSDL